MDRLHDMYEKQSRELRTNSLYKTKFKFVLRLTRKIPFNKIDYLLLSFLHEQQLSVASFCLWRDISLIDERWKSFVQCIIITDYLYDYEIMKHIMWYHLNIDVLQHVVVLHHSLDDTNAEPCNYALFFVLMLMLAIHMSYHSMLTSFFYH